MDVAGKRDILPAMDMTPPIAYLLRRPRLEVLDKEHSPIPLEPIVTRIE